MEVASLRNHVYSSLDKYGLQSAEQASKFNEHLEIIRRYDEVISDKASKQALFLAETRLSEQFKSEVIVLDTRIKNNLQLIEEQREYFNEFKEILTAEVFTAVKKATLKEIKSYESQQASKSPSKLLGLNQVMQDGEQGLLRILSLKADKDDTERLYEMKTNREDTENMVDLIEPVFAMPVPLLRTPP